MTYSSMTIDRNLVQNIPVKKLAICIPVHGISKALEKSLESIDLYIRPICDECSIECILLISNSGDNFSIERYWKGKSEIIKVPLNYYWSAGVQKLFIVAKEHNPTHVLLMNHDVLLKEDSFAQLVYFTESHPDSILSSVSIAMEDGNVENAGFNYTNGGFPLVNLYMNSGVDLLPKDPYSVSALNGRFVLFPSPAANPDFLLPYKIPHYFADAVLSAKARRNGFPLKVIPSSIILSDRSDTEFKRARQRCDSFQGFLNCLFKPYSYRYIWGNFWGQLLIPDRLFIGLNHSVKYTSLRIIKSFLELVRIVDPL